MKRKATSSLTKESMGIEKRSRMELCRRMTKQLLLKEVEKGNYKNLVLSPLSIDVVLNMVAVGSKGRTLEKLLGWLGSKDMEEIKSQSLQMMAVAGGDQYLEKGEEEPVLCLVNGAWFDQRFPPKSSYKEDVLKGIYGCEAKTVDFVTRGDEVVDEINLWAEDASRGLIKNFLPRGSLSPETVLILANGLYFKGNWEHDFKFDANHTKNRPFYLLNGDTVSVPFMTSRKRYRRCRSFEGFKVLEIPYQSKSKQFSMYFFLPDEREGLQNLLEKLISDSGFSYEYCCLGETRLDKFWIPKFKFSYDFDVSLTMKEMGMSFPFMENSEDIAEMVQIHKNVPFSGSQMIQKASIEVDEKGTVGTTITAFCCFAKRAKGKPESTSFVADHPFMFMIMEERSRFVIFTGAVLDPSKVE
ncbi:serpin-Z10-like [Rhododendron vialii]|uniref:serpin-Z10-like n=1 Tax=Rhododendron vialii TaxID=182163 RepID=UPI00265DA7F0|nr:serpin-Z10-like [Rhododendron vialii]